jgi:NADH-quinone oxidoreductase subunit C
MADELEKGLGGLEAGPESTERGEPERGPASAVSYPSVVALRERFGDAVLHHELQAGDEHVVFVEADRLTEIMRWLHDDASQRYDFLADVTAVDYGGGRPLQVVYQLWSIPLKQALRVKAELPLSGLEIDSVVPIWAAANWLEREVYDLFGIEFRNHPDLRRIMMPDNYAEGHPLRKDFPLRGRFSRAEQTRRALSFDLADYYAPTELDVLRKGDWQRAQERAAKEKTAGRAEFPGDVEESRDPRDTTPSAEEKG